MASSENEIKLNILESLARSQRALARIIETVADISEYSQSTAAHIANHIDIINKYQQALMGKMTKIQIRKIKKGSHTKPWLHPKVQLKL